MKTLITSVVGCWGKTKKMETITSTLMTMITNGGGSDKSNKTNDS